MMSEADVPPILTVDNLVKRFAKQNLAGQRENVLALDGASLTIPRGKTLALVGESGSGKSTLALSVACLENPTSGSIWFEGSNLVGIGNRERRKLRTQIQLIFQDPASSLNPRWSALEILIEPLLVQNELSSEEMKRRASGLLESVGLAPEILKRSPQELSGGQRQRLALARALSLDPKLLILDEALSALDCSVQAQIANLLMQIQNSTGMTYLFITHDLTMAAHLADEIAVMHSGRIVESGVAADVLSRPQCEITRQLLAAAPRMAPAALPGVDR